VLQDVGSLNLRASKHNLRMDAIKKDAREVRQKLLADDTHANSSTLVGAQTLSIAKAALSQIKPAALKTK
jgi:hypothetical protein